MSRADLLALAARVEAATEQEEPAFIAAAACLVSDDANRICGMVNVGMRLDAAMALLGDRPSFDLSHDHEIQGAKWQCLVGDVDGWVPDGRATASTPALALTAAAIRALAELRNARQFDGCDVCGGDCSAANPPVINCPRAAAGAA